MDSFDGSQPGFVVVNGVKTVVPAHSVINCDKNHNWHIPSSPPMVIHRDEIEDAFNVMVVGSFAAASPRLVSRQAGDA